MNSWNRRRFDKILRWWFDILPDRLYISLMKSKISAGGWPTIGKAHATTAAFAITLTLLLLVSCSGKKEKFGPAPYAANAALTGAPVSIPELSLQFAPPKGWQPLDSTQLASFRKMLNNTELQVKFYHINLLNAYMDSISGCIAYIARIEENNVPIAGVAQKYHDFAAPRSGIKALDENLYLINDLPVYHFLVRAMTSVNYKLLGEAAPGKRFLIEYILRAESFSQVEQSVEASIAALRRTTEP